MNLFVMPELGTLLAMSYFSFDSFDLNSSLFWYNPFLMHEFYRKTNPGFYEKIQQKWPPDFTLKMKYSTLGIERYPHGILPSVLFEIIWKHEWK